MGADSVGGQLLGDTEYFFGGITNSGSVWKDVPESEARNVESIMTQVVPRRS